MKNLVAVDAVTVTVSGFVNHKLVMHNSFLKFKHNKNGLRWKIIIALKPKPNIFFQMHTTGL